LSLRSIRSVLRPGSRQPSARNTYSPIQDRAARVPRGRVDAGQDLADDRLELGQHRHPALSAALGTVRTHVHPARPLEVPSLQMPQFMVADPGADAEESDALFAARDGGRPGRR